MTVLDQIAQRFAVAPVGDLGGIEAQEGREIQPWRGARRAAVGDQDLLDPLGEPLQPLAHAQRPPLPEAGEGDRGGAAVKVGGGLGLEGLRIDQDRRQAAALQRQGQGGAGHAGSGNQDVAGERAGHAGICGAGAQAVQPSVAVNAP